MTRKKDEEVRVMMGIGEADIRRAVGAGSAVSDGDPEGGRAW